MESMEHDPAMTKQQSQLTGEGASGLGFYKELAVGSEASLLHFLGFELGTLLFANLPGILGYGTRSLYYPMLFQKAGRRPAFGRGVVIRRPANISIGNKVLIDDYATLDVRGRSGSIKIEDKVSIGRFSSIVSKEAQIQLSAGVNIGSYCRLASQSKLEIGESTLIAAYCYVGPGNHQQADPTQPLISQEMEIKGGVKIGSRCWLGARATILDGVTIGDDAIIGAHSLVLEDIPAGAIAVGSPAKIIKMRS
jgi:acetyltransferase-like isoleucine patch superfamily enzyme